MKKISYHDGQIKHYSVGALIREHDRYLLIERATWPFAWGCIAGHIDIEDASPEDALHREVQEEMGLEVITQTLVYQGLEANKCRDGTGWHESYVYRTLVCGQPQPSQREVKTYGWFTREEIATMQLTPFWTKMFKQL